MFKNLPGSGTWKLSGAYEGMEKVHFTYSGEEIILKGSSVGVEADIPWSIHYTISVGKDWKFKHATVTNDTGKRLEIRADNGIWSINGEKKHELSGCIDLDLEASSVTNTLPVHRLMLPIGARGSSNAAYIRTNDFSVERLDQVYLRLPDDKDGLLRFEYSSPRFNYYDVLRFSPDGLIQEYPAIGSRVS